MKVWVNLRGCIETHPREVESLEDIEGFDRGRAQPADPRRYFEPLGIEVLEQRHDLKCCNDEEAQIAVLILMSRASGSAV